MQPAAGGNANDVLQHGRSHWSILRCIANEVSQHLESLMFAWAAGFFNHDCQAIEFRLDFGSGQSRDSCRQNRRFDDGVLRPIETEKIALPAVTDHVGDDLGSRLAIVDRAYPEGVPAASVGQDDAGDCLATNGAGGGSS